MNTFDKLLLEIRQHLAEFTFRKRRSNFYLKINDSWCVIGFQKSSTSNKETAKFTINIGVSLKAIQHKGYNDTKPEDLKFPMSDSIYSFLPQKYDVWWKLNEDNLFEVVLDIVGVIDNVILPLFQKYTVVDNALEIALGKSGRWFGSDFNRVAFLVSILKVTNSDLFDSKMKELEDISIRDDMDIQFSDFKESLQ